MSGKVYLVGAGPGDPELLTVKACRILGEAGVILHDDLVNPEVLRLASRLALIENVGKRCGEHRITQDEINLKIVTYAVQGMTVVRLKGGDPLLFGRAGEEISAMRSAGVEFEIIPGVSAAFGAAAFAQIPLTDRKVASNVMFLSNHHCAGNDVPLKSSIPEDTTVVVYMPGSDYAELAGKLCASGLDKTTPCLIVSRATCNQQNILAETLESLPNEQGLPAPALLIVGGVAGSYAGGQKQASNSIASILTNESK